MIKTYDFIVIFRFDYLTNDAKLSIYESNILNDPIINLLSIYYQSIINLLSTYYQSIINLLSIYYQSIKLLI